MYKSSVERIKKYVPSQPTSAHWYSPESLKVLVFSHIAEAERGGRDLPLGEFVRQFQGLARTATAKEVCKEVPTIKHLSDFREKPEHVRFLLSAMRALSKPPKAAALSRKLPNRSGGAPWRCWWACSPILAPTAARRRAASVTRASCAPPAPPSWGCSR